MSAHLVGDFFGTLAALCMLSAFNCKNVVLLRCISMAASLFFILYASAMGLMPILLLHGILLPLNGMRLLQDLKSQPAGSGKGSDSQVAMTASGGAKGGNS